MTLRRAVRFCTKVPAQVLALVICGCFPPQIYGGIEFVVQEVSSVEPNVSAVRGMSWAIGIREDFYFSDGADLYRYDGNEVYQIRMPESQGVEILDEIDGRLLLGTHLGDTHELLTVAGSDITTLGTFSADCCGFGPLTRVGTETFIPAGGKLYKTDGDKLTLVSDSNVGHRAGQFAIQNEELFFTAGISARDVYRTNGNAVQQVTFEGFVDSSNSNLRGLHVLEDRVFFSPNSPGVSPLYWTDGTSTEAVIGGIEEHDAFVRLSSKLGDHVLYSTSFRGTSRTGVYVVSYEGVAEFHELDESISNIYQFNDALYFGGLTDGFYRFDGDTVSQVSEYGIGIANPIDEPATYVEFNNELYVNGGRCSDDSEEMCSGFIYRTDGQNFDVIAEFPESGPRSFGTPVSLELEFAGRLLFSAPETDGMLRLYSYDGSTVAQVSDLSVPSQGGYQHFVEFGGEVFFAGGPFGSLHKLFILGDFDRDAQLGIGDINALTPLAGSNSQDPAFDLNADGFVTDLDRTIWIEELAETVTGDTNLDGTVGFDDFLALASKFGGEGGWESGDFDGTGSVGFPDFLLLASNFGFQRVPITPVPEPEAGLLCLLATAFSLLRRPRVPTR